MGYIEGNDSYTISVSLGDVARKLWISLAAAVYAVSTSALVAAVTEGPWDVGWMLALLLALGIALNMAVALVAIVMTSNHWDDIKRARIWHKKLTLRIPRKSRTNATLPKAQINE
jgi:hypothetical protein